MALPNPSMSFSPFAILTAEEMNDIVENIESLAAGSGFNAGAIDTEDLANDAVTSDKVDWATFRLGRSTITSAATSTAPLATPTEVTGLAVTFTLTETRTVRAHVFASSWYNSVASYQRVIITNGAVSTANIIGFTANSATAVNVEYTLNLVTERTLPAGTYTFRVGMSRSSGTISMAANADQPASLTVDIVA